MRPKSEPTAAEQAVARFEEAQKELQQFVAEHGAIVDELQRIIDNYNAAISEASLAIKNDLRNSNRDKLVIGNFGAIKKRKDYWDGMELAELIPGRISKHFLTEKLSYDVDVPRLEQMIRQGDVDRDEAYKAFHQEPPTLALMPGTPKALKL